MCEETKAWEIRFIHLYHLLGNGKGLTGNSHSNPDWVSDASPYALKGKPSYFLKVLQTRGTWQVQKEAS